MTSTRLLICAATFTLLSVASVAAAPAYVRTTVHLRAGAGTDKEILAKIPGGSLVDATNCTDWCEVDWQGKKGFAIATALDRSGRVPTRPAAPRAYAPPPGYAVVEPPVYYGPPVYYPRYRPYYWGGPLRYWGYRRWRYW
jgi:uncharacterized protein YraI